MMREGVASILNGMSNGLSLAESPRQFLGVALDALAELISLEAGWALLADSSSGSLLDSCYLGFTPQLRRELETMNLRAPPGAEHVKPGKVFVIPRLVFRASRTPVH